MLLKLTAGKFMNLSLETFTNVSLKIFRFDAYMYVIIYNIYKLFIDVV